MSSHGRIGWHKGLLTSWYKHLNDHLKDIVRDETRKVIGVEVEAIVAHLEGEEDQYIHENILADMEQMYLD